MLTFQPQETNCDGFLLVTSCTRIITITFRAIYTESHILLQIFPFQSNKAHLLLKKSVIRMRTS